MRVMGIGVVLVAALLQAGCASMSQQQCLSGNWGQVGYDDGVAGYPASRLASHEKACATHGVRADVTPYLDARERGLRVYCTPYRGFVVGSNGQNYAGVCPAGLERGFLAGHADGRHVYEAQQEASRAASEVSDVERRIRNLRKDIDAVQARIDKTDTADADRASLRKELRGLRDDLKYADTDLRTAERREHKARQDAEYLERRLAPAYGG